MVFQDSDNCDMNGECRIPLFNKALGFGYRLPDKNWTFPFPCPDYLRVARLVHRALLPAQVQVMGKSHL